MDLNHKQKEKLRELKFLTKILSQNKLHLCSNFGNLNYVENYKPQEQDANVKRSKPLGLWYAKGRAWLGYLFHNRGHYGDWSTKWLLEYSHIYEIEVDTSRMLFLNTSTQITSFSLRYGQPANRLPSIETNYPSLDDYEDKNLIRWDRVAKEFGGIEIKYNFQKKMSLLWYDNWSCTSGCIWGEGMLKDVKLIWQNSPLIEEANLI